MGCKVSNQYNLGIVLREMACSVDDGAPFFRFGHLGVSGIPAIEEMFQKTFSVVIEFGRGDRKQIPEGTMSAVCSKQFPPKVGKRI